MARIKVVVPVSTSMWNKPAVAEMEKYKDADTQIDVVNITKGPESIECTYDEAWAELFTVLECEKAEKEGYDGVISYCFSDPAVRAAKEKLNIPVVGINEPAVHIASQLGHKFSIITLGRSQTTTSGLLVEKLKLYGLEHKCASIRSLAIPVSNFEKEKDKEEERVFEEAKKAIEEDGADTIVLGCGCMFGVGERVREELHVQVVSPAVAAIKTCEMLIKMGLSQSKRYFATPPEKKRIV